MRLKPEIKELLAWLEIEGNSAAKLANAMGYKSSSTIGKWIKVNRVPTREVGRLLQAIRKK